MRKYAIVTEDRALGYWFTGKTYKHHYEAYAVFAMFDEREKAKTWQTRKAAQNAARKLEERCCNLWGGDLEVIELINQ